MFRHVRAFVVATSELHQAGQVLGPGVSEGEAWEICIVLADSQISHAKGHRPKCCGGTGQPGEQAASQKRRAAQGECGRQRTNYFALKNSSR